MITFGDHIYDPSVDERKYQIQHDPRRSLYKITIKRVSFDDAGAYKCIAKDPILAQVIVTSVPVCRPRAPILRESRSHSFFCEITSFGGKRPKLVWKLNETEIKGSLTHQAN